MRYATAFIFTVLLVSLSPKKRKVRFVYIEDELAKAKIIADISIIRYTDTSLVCYTINDSFNLKCILQPGLDLVPLISHTLPNDNRINTLAGKWPTPGQRVLLVADSTNRVKLFALLMDRQYRFWDPNSGPFRNSIFLFPNDSAYSNLPVCLDYINRKEISSCEDGCLVNVSIVSQRIPKE